MYIAAFSLIKYLIQKETKSKYTDWFFIHKYPIRPDPTLYDCVGDYAWMPKINLSCPDAAAYFISVGKYWITEFGIDGWRLDVADEVPTEFLEHFAAEIKAVSPNAILIGETWGNANRLIRGNRLNSAMNYLFRDAAVAWLAHREITPSQFDHLANQQLALYPREVMLRMYNPLDSHDTARFLFDCKNNINLYKMGVALQITFPGCPAIFYGDEVGVTGDTDPLCRQAMEWDSQKQNPDILAWFCALTDLRKRSVSLYEGDYRTVLCDDKSNTYGFVRSAAHESTLVIFNVGAQTCTVSLPFMGGTWQSVFLPVSGEISRSQAKQTAESFVPTEYKGQLEIELPAYCVKILQMKEKV